MREKLSWKTKGEEKEWKKSLSKWKVFFFYFYFIIQYISFNQFIYLCFSFIVYPATIPAGRFRPLEYTRMEMNEIRWKFPTVNDDIVIEFPSLYLYIFSPYICLVIIWLICVCKQFFFFIEKFNNFFFFYIFNQQVFLFQYFMRKKRRMEGRAWWGGGKSKVGVNFCF